MMFDNTNAALDNVEVHYLNSTEVGDEFKIMIAHPVIAIPEGARLPVFYVLDANSNFGIVTDIVRSATLMGLPAAYIVGIGYRSNGRLSDAFVQRSRDLTPTVMPMFDQYGASLAGISNTVIKTGGAEAFLRFIRQELKPFIEQRYPVLALDNTLISMSLGGLFASSVLFSQPDTFQRYLVCSPSLWWDREIILDREVEWSKRHTELAARVFFAAGDRERDPYHQQERKTLPPEWKPLLDSFSNRDGKNRLAELVEIIVPVLKSRNYPGLKISSKIFEHETHATVFPRALIAGLSELFAQQ